MSQPAAAPVPGGAAAVGGARAGTARPAPSPARPLPGSLGAAREEDAAWCLVVDGDAALDDPGARAAESLLCLADGVIGTRGVLEGGAGGSPSVVAAGLYRPAAGVGETLMILPGWCALPLRGDLPPGRRVLDLRDGLLTRVVAGGDAGMRSARFACAERPGVAVLVAEVGPGALATGPAGATFDADDAPREWRSPLGGGAVRASATTACGHGPGGTTRVERVAVYTASPRGVPSGALTQRRLVTASGLGPAQLLAEQRAAWAARWADGDVEVVGDPETTLIARLALFHLWSSARVRGEAAVGARGLTGPAYAGHVLWDTDVFVTPVLAAVDPPRARAVLEYRLRRLAVARSRAEADGRRGARFPWESARDGTDVTPTSGLDHHAAVVPIRTGSLEEHVTADVAWSAWTYATWTGDWSFLTSTGRPLLLDSARYWASRVRLDGAGRAHIDGVIGPDEYHEAVDDNAFTNVMARWNLRRAAALVDRRGDAAEAREAHAWRRLARDLVDGYDPASGLYEQFAGYHRLEPLLAADLGPVPVAADLVLGAARLAGSQIIKQADVLMAHHLVPDEVAPGSLAANLDHYLARTAHGSSLSPAVHAALLARAGRPEEALELLHLAAAIDLDDLTETTGGGLHLANLGGVWQAVAMGFAGLRLLAPDDPALTVDPCLPAGWSELRLRFRWHGRRVRLACRHDGVHVGCDQPIRAVVHGTPVPVDPPGRWIA